MKIIPPPLLKKGVLQPSVLQKEIKKGVTQEGEGSSLKKSPKKVLSDNVGLQKNRDVKSLPEESKINMKAATFKEELDSAAQEQFRKNLEELFIKIDEQSKVLLNSPIYENLLVYKELVQTFMRTTVRNLYRISTNSSGRTANSKKVYFVIEKVNERLAKLTEDILISQTDSIRIAQRLEEIKGLLVDLYS